MICYLLPAGTGQGWRLLGEIVVENGGEQSQDPHTFEQWAVRAAALVQEVGSFDDRRRLSAGLELLLESVRQTLGAGDCVVVDGGRKRGQ